jgi:nucleoside 2-deoxyribosyltransferase
MKIVVAGSMTVVEKMIEIKEVLEKKGHEIILSKFAYEYINLPKEDIEKQTIHDKNNNDGLKELSMMIKDADAILALNYDKKGIKNYIGGNTFLELGYASIIGKKVYFMNPIPDMLYTSELEAMKPIILNEDLSKIG